MTVPAQNSFQDNILLLKRFEPVICFTRGEQYFPMDVEPYVRINGLWAFRPESQSEECLIPPGQLNLQNLAENRPDSFNAVHYLMFPEPEGKRHPAPEVKLARRDLNSSREVFKAGAGRLARVGYVARFVDALFTLTMLTRGHVTRQTAQNCRSIYLGLMQENEHYCYHGRVIHDPHGQWIALQYWFFYFFNNFRSGFFGINDHIADWEMICIYLYQDTNAEIRPQWVAYASHDFAGDDLRRNWDDPEVEKVGEHPIIYAGAGSHASYFSRGEYMIEYEIPFLKPVANTLDKVQKAWNRTLKQGNPQGNGYFSSIFRIPFVDYARGDGITIGPGQDIRWDDPVLLNPAPDWVTGYRGLWGLYTRDRFGGENAPAGPAYNRDGSERRAWHDPFGWAGMDKVSTPVDEILSARQQISVVENRKQTLLTTIEEKQAVIRQLQTETTAMYGAAHLGKLYKQRLKQIETTSDEIKELYRQMATEDSLQQALNHYIENHLNGKNGSLRAHIQHAHLPVSENEKKTGKVVEFWSAVSIGLLMLVFVALVMFARDYMLWGLVAIITTFTFVESWFQHRLTNLLSSLAVGLSLVCSLVLLYEFFWYIISAIVLAAGVYILWGNLKELWE